MIVTFEPADLGSVDPEIGPVEGCRAPDCELGTSQNGHFCGNHWRILPLEAKNAVLHARDDAALLDAALTRALYEIRRKVEGWNRPTPKSERS